MGPSAFASKTISVLTPKGGNRFVPMAEASTDNARVMRRHPQPGRDTNRRSDCTCSLTDAREAEPIRCMTMLQFSNIRR